MIRQYLLPTALAVLACIGGIATIRAAETAQPALARKELKTAIANAANPQDHQRIAAYYKKEADHMLAEAKEHEELAAVYTKAGNMHASKHPMSGQTAEHCKYFADATRKAAQELLAMAKLHDDMAKQTH